MRRLGCQAALLVLGIVSASAAAPPRGTVHGTVRDSDGQPIQGARVCYMEGRYEDGCVETDDEGAFELAPSKLTRVRVLVRDFLPQTFDVAAVPAPIVMKRAPSLLVRLIDASSGKPISQGQVFVIYPSGARKGPFPTNKAGVRIQRVLEPGAVRLTAEAEGFVTSEPMPLTLEAGHESEAVVELDPVPGRER